MHQITDINAAQRVDDRMQAPASDDAWPPSPHRTACTANRCGSGDRRCPCPDACQLPDGSVLGRALDCLERVPVRHFWIGYATFMVALLSGLHLIFNT